MARAGQRRSGDERLAITLNGQLESLWYAEAGPLTPTIGNGLPTAVQLQPSNMPLLRLESGPDCLTGWAPWDAIVMDQLRPAGARDHPADSTTSPTIRTTSTSRRGTRDPGLSDRRDRRRRGRVVAHRPRRRRCSTSPRDDAAAQGIANIETQVCSADALPFADATFDSVSVRFGYMFFPDLDQATAEFTRVLKPGGRLCSSVWVKPEANPWTSIAMQTIATETVVAPPGTNVFGVLHDVQCSLQVTGLRDIAEWDVDVALVTRSPERYWEMISEHVSLAVAALQQVDAPAAGAASRRAVVDRVSRLRRRRRGADPGRGPLHRRHEVGTKTGCVQLNAGLRTPGTRGRAWVARRRSRP